MATIKEIFNLWGYIQNLDSYLGDGWLAIAMTTFRNLKDEYEDDGELSKAEVAEVLGKALLAWAESQGEPID